MIFNKKTVSSIFVKIKERILFLLIILFIVIGAYFFFRPTAPGSAIIYHNSLSEDTVASGKKEKLLFEYCKVWGILKYHFRTGNTNNYLADDLAISAYNEITNTDKDFNQIVAEQIKRLTGAPNDSTDYNYIGGYPDETWLKKSSLLSNPNKRALRKYILNAYGSDNYFYADQKPDGSLNLDNDSLYTRITKTNEAIRFLSLCKIWNVIRYFYPYFEDISAGWNDAFFDMLPQFLKARSEKEYHLAALRMSTYLKDSHVFCESLVTDFYFKKYVGNVLLKTIDNRTFVKNQIIKSGGSNLKTGDEILMINGKDINSCRDSIKYYISGSTNATRERDVNKYLLQFDSDKVEIVLIRSGQQIKVRENLNTIEYMRSQEEKEHRSFASQIVSTVIGDNIGYINFKHIFSGNFRISFEKIEKCKAIIFDLRSYPNETGIRFMKYFDTFKNDPMAMYAADINSPGYMRTIRGQTHIPQSNKDAYKRPVIILINEYTQSQAESLVLAMKNIKNSKILGSYSAGTNGNIAVLYLPNRLAMQFSGIGVLTTSYQKLQRIGIKPDIIVNETIESLETGTDIQLQQALTILNSQQ